MIQKPKGTIDILPDISYKWQYMEKETQKILENYGFREIRVPVFESTTLFERGVGDTTDVVQKEMYTFFDKANRSITLRPEGTAGIVRAYIENGMSSLPSPQKMWYAMPMYRYENVQKGRLREFRQIGAEIIGTASYLADIELLIMANEIIKNFNLPEVQLKINNIGCHKCRKNYQEELKKFVANNLEKYCETCKTRFEKNPMRILDCKEKMCKELNKKAPIILDYLCEECKEHFEGVKQTLEKVGIDYEIDSKLVRGLDYYTKTVFEFVSQQEGYTILAGGRYDALIEQLGGQSTPAIGFAMGEDRLINLYEKYRGENIKPKVADLYIASIGEEADKRAIKIAQELRKKDCYVEKDITSRSIKAQLKYADKQKIKYIIVIGEDELKSEVIKIKNMKTGEEKNIQNGNLVMKIYDYIKNGESV
ncbi:MAG: histidine--tRNA ligase [Clostridia bacterium]|jgi:histidyl-tRNA synthetase|nr:histidine--tRNA ligase [Clostridia bacterium]